MCVLDILQSNTTINIINYPLKKIGIFYPYCFYYLFTLSLVFSTFILLYLVWYFFAGIHQVFIRRRQWHPTPVLLPGESHGWRSLVGCSPWGREESDTTERLHFHFSLSCIGEGNGNPLQCSCLEKPRDWGAWQAAISGVAQSQTQLERLNSSSNYVFIMLLEFV